MKKRKPLIYQKDYTPERLKLMACFLSASEPLATRHAIDVLACGAWFEEVRLETRERTAYAVGKKIQPHTYKSARGDQAPHHHNLWSKYARGLIRPGDETVKAASRVAPQTEDILTTHAWLALDVSHPLQDKGNELLRALRLGVQQAVFNPNYIEFRRYVRRPTLGRTLKMLEVRADLDSVAAIVILLRESHEAGDRAKALTLGESLHNVLLMAAISTPLLCIRFELMLFFKYRIFPMASSEEIAFDLDPSVMCEQSRILSSIMLILEDATRIGFTHKGATGELRKIIEGDFGMDLQYGLMPRWALVKPAHESTEAARRLVANRGILRDWGLGVLRSGRVQQFVPDEVFDRMTQVDS
ncbi:hypothetical protein DWU98_04520 [Dyella monticola]|uniref:Uncharacterized protein n=1 Tax=Dyella monticola TaxID=1927958 RepID=A0A370X5A2_9GAMM|nr:hypothetical protein [Dyella monticola]RDS83603.1 hypothetical protein DWU98_04520 [Dyella monticola]